MDLRFFQFYNPTGYNQRDVYAARTQVFLAVARSQRDEIMEIMCDMSMSVLTSAMFKRFRQTELMVLKNTFDLVLPFIVEKDKKKAFEGFMRIQRRDVFKSMGPNTTLKERCQVQEVVDYLTL